MPRMLPRRRQTPELTPLESRFIHEYMLDMDATEAMRRINPGLSKQQASARGGGLKRRPRVAQQIALRLEARAIRTEITQDQVLTELKTLAFSDITHYQVNAQGQLELAPGAPPDAMRAVRSIKRRMSKGQLVEVEIKLWDKPGTLKLAGQHTGLFTDKLEVRIGLIDLLLPKDGPVVGDGT